MAYKKSAEQLLPFARAALAIGYSPELLIAQLAQEAAWGDEPSGKNNLFGLVYFPRIHGSHPYSWHPTREELTPAEEAGLDPEERATITSRRPLGNGKNEVRLRRRFLDFASVDDCIRHKAEMITKGARYREAWEAFETSGDVEQLIRGIAAAGYATGAGYADRLIAIARQGNVREASNRARAELSKAVDNA